MHTYLAQWRRFRKLGQKQLAAVAGVSIQTISNIESERGGLTSQMLERLAMALGCTTTELVAINPLEHRELYRRRVIRTTHARDLRITAAILQSLADLMDRNPERLPRVLRAAERLAGRTRKRQSAGR